MVACRCSQVPAGLHSASHEQPMQCQRQDGKEMKGMPSLHMHCMCIAYQRSVCMSLFLFNLSPCLLESRLELISHFLISGDSSVDGP